MKKSLNPYNSYELSDLSLFSSFSIQKMGISGNLEYLSDHASKTVNAVTAPTIHKIPTTSIIPKACPSTVAERIVATSGSTHPSILP